MDWNKDKFASLLKEAQGNRSINKFGNDADVDPGYISRLMRSLVDSPPGASVIRKLGEKSHNGIKTIDLMTAAGYVEENTEQKQSDLNSNLPELTEKDERDIAKRMEKMKKDLLEGTDGDGLNFMGEPMSEEAKESLLDALEYAERQATRMNKKYIPKKHRDKQ